jgi:hypothetical protein
MGSIQRNIRALGNITTNWFLEKSLKCERKCRIKPVLAGASWELIFSGNIRFL